MQGREQELEKAAAEAMAASTAAAEEHAAEEEHLAKLRHELGGLQDKVREQCLLQVLSRHRQECAGCLMQQQIVTWIFHVSGSSARMQNTPRHVVCMILGTLW